MSSAFEKVFAARDYLTSMSKFLTSDEMANVIALSKTISTDAVYQPSNINIRQNDENSKKLESQNLRYNLKGVELTVETLAGVKHIPSSVRAIVADREFSGVISSFDFPSNVKKVDFSNCDIINNINVDWSSFVMSQHLQVIIFSRNFNNDLREVEMPRSLRVLKLGKRYNHPLADLELSENLEELQLPATYSHSLKGWEPLNNLKILEMLPDNDREKLPSLTQTARPISDIVTSPRLERLSIGDVYLLFDGVKFPETLKALKLSDYCEQGLPPNSLPGTLEALDLGLSYRESLKDYRLPTGLKFIKIPSSYYHKNRDHDLLPFFPDSVETLQIYTDNFNHTDMEIPRLNLPLSLTKLEINNGYVTVDLSNLAIPEGFKNVDISIFNYYSNAKLKLPSTTTKLKTSYLPKLVYPIKLEELYITGGYQRNIHKMFNVNWFHDHKKLRVLKLYDLTPLTGNLKHLHNLEELECLLSDHTELPESLKKATLVFEQNVSAQYPETLETLTVSPHPDSYHDFCGTRFPESVKTLTIKPCWGRSYKWHKIVDRNTIFPPNLEELTIEGTTFDSVDDLDLPRTIKRLNVIFRKIGNLKARFPLLEEFPTSDISILDNAVFPDKLKTIELKPFVDVFGRIKLPLNLQELVFEANSRDIEFEFDGYGIKRLVANNICTAHLEDVIVHFTSIDSVEVENLIDSDYVKYIDGVRKFKIRGGDCYIGSFVFDEDLKELDISAEIIVDSESEVNFPSSLKVLKLSNTLLPGEYRINLPPFLEELSLSGYSGELSNLNFPPTLRKFTSEIDNVDDVLNTNMPDGVLVKVGNKTFILNRNN